MIVKANGASDDVVELEVDGKLVEEFDALDARVEFTICDGAGSAVPRLIVAMWHDGNRGWMTELRLPDTHEDGDPIPRVSFDRSETGYSLALVVELPASSEIRVSSGKKTLEPEGVLRGDGRWVADGEEEF